MFHEVGILASIGVPAFAISAAFLGHLLQIEGTINVLLWSPPCL
jgi:hypothetical protein